MYQALNVNENKMERSYTTPETKKVDKQSAMSQLLSELEIQIERYAKNNSRLSQSVTGLEVEPPSDAVTKDQALPVQFSGGYLHTLSNLIEQLRNENYRAEYQLSRLEKFV